MLALANMSNILVLSAHKGQPLPKSRGAQRQEDEARPGYDRTVMLGNCIIKREHGERQHQEPVEVTAVRPDADVVAALKSAGLEVNEAGLPRYAKQQSEKYNGRKLRPRDCYRDKVPEAYCPGIRIVSPDAPFMPVFMLFRESERLIL